MYIYIYLKLQKNMLIGDVDYPIAQAVLFFVLIVSLVGNVILFQRGEGNYSIKYELMRKHEFFRANQCALYTIEYIYKGFFCVPFLLILTISILRAIDDVNNLAPLLINGTIILLLLYPTKKEHSNIKNFIMWLFAFASAIAVMFLYLQTDDAVYYLLSALFYSANILFFFLSLLCIEGTYWEIGEAIDSAKCKEELEEVNDLWGKGKENLPAVFDGGIYGYFCKNKSFKTYALLYIISLLFLGLYAFLIWLLTDSYLGIVGLVSNIIYDIFIKIFNSLNSNGRSLVSVYVVLVCGRLLSFVFGRDLWLLGYCVLYFGVAIFIGWMMIDRHLPLKQPDPKHKVLNGLKTPEFVLLVLTVELVVMMLVQSYSLQAAPPLQYNDIEIPVWHWGVIVLLATWAIIVYMASYRFMARHHSKIKPLTEYYFGVPGITEYHMYLLLCYVIFVALGLYSYLFLNDKVIFMGCIFVPLIYLCCLSWAVSWVKNEYQILADTDDYNKRSKRAYEIKVKQLELMQKNKSLEGQKKQMMMSKFKERNSGFLPSLSKIQPEVIDRTEHDLMNHQEQTTEREEKLNDIYKIDEWEPLRNWRDSVETIGFCDVWSCLTPSDKKLIVASVILVLLLCGYCVACMLWAQSQFAISFMVCFISYSINLVYYRCYKNNAEILGGQLIASWLGFILGVVYWAVYHEEVIGPIVYAFLYLVIAGFCAQKAFKHELELPIKISLSAQVILAMVFILVILGVHRDPIYVAVFAVLFLLVIISLIPVFYWAAHQHLPTSLLLPTSLTGGIIIISMSVVGYVLDAISGFSIFTLIMVLIWVVLLGTSAGFTFRKEYLRQQEAPSVYSSYGYPNYRFESAKEELKSNSTHLNIFSASMITLIVYAVFVSIFFNQKSYAVYALCLFIVIDFFIKTRISMITYYQIGLMRDLLDEELVVSALRKLKDEYMIEETEGEDSPHFQAQLERCKKLAQDTNDPQLWKNVVMNHDMLVKNLQEEEKFLFFWIVLIKFNLYAKKRASILNTIQQLEEINDQLMENGILLHSIKDSMKIEEKYEKLMKQIEGLSPVDFLIYQQIRSTHQKSIKKQNQAQKQQHLKEEERSKKRDEILFDKQKEMDEDEEIQKFKQLVKKVGRKNLYEDEEFPADQSSLGDDLSMLVKGWRRPNIGQVFAKNGISADDVKQGDIGDCYLISSFGVLGEKRIKEAIGFQYLTNDNGEEKEIERWTNDKGAFMVRFYKYSKKFYVTIDDQIPVNEYEERIFAKSEDPVEFWPAILEKAYAKLYKGYQNIVEGNCHRVLAEFTGGFPIQIVLQNYSGNPNGLWTQVINGKNNGYLLAAGSSPHADGDKAFSKKGIVKGHAYSVLDAREVDQYKLIKLKNPHGSGGREWTGSFSDDSDFMTKRMLKLLNHQKSGDGIFWMPIEDFIRQFKSLYICCVFDKKWKKLMKPGTKGIKGEWTQRNSYGRTKYQGIQKNPQYGIKVTKKCTVFISLTQEAENSLSGKNPIHMRVQRNEGRRMKREDINSDKLCGKLQKTINSITISSEMELEAENYPYTFTLLVCCAKPGQTGEYSLEIYCNDTQGQLIDDEQFDPIAR